MRVICVFTLVLGLAGVASLVPTTAQQAGKPAPAKTAGATKAAPAGAVRTIDIIGTDDMKFNVTNITAKRGEQLRVRVTSKGTLPKIAMAHNFVLLNAKANQIKFAEAAAQARATDFIPPDMKAQVIANTTLAGPGETVEVTFKVPATAGSYPYLCTFPGHFAAGMRGTLAVK
jgi:azurin